MLIFKSLTSFLLFFLPALGYSGINFIHIPKTGGTTIHSLLENQFSTNEIFPYRGYSKGIVYDKLHVRKYELISGNFPIWFLEAKGFLDNSSYTFTVLREPIDRSLSEYRYIKKFRPDEEAERRIVPNTICYHLSSDKTLQGEDLLENAKQNLDKLDYIVFFDTFEDDVYHLMKQLGIDNSSYDLPKFNQTAKIEIDPEVLENIILRNNLDILLYEYAKKLKKNNCSHKQEYKSFECLKEPSKNHHYTFDMPLRGKNWFYRQNVGTKLPVYRWINGDKASMIFSLLPGSDYLLTFYAKALSKDIEPFIEINGFKLWPNKSDKNDLDFSEYLIYIPKEILYEEKTEIFFCGTNSYKFNQVYPGFLDDRNISICLNKINLKAL